MNGMTLLTISAPGWFGVQAKRAIGLPAQSVRATVRSRRCFAGIVAGVRRLGKSQAVADVDCSSAVVDEFHRARPGRRRLPAPRSPSGPIATAGNDRGPAHEVCTIDAGADVSGRSSCRRERGRAPCRARLSIAAAQKIEDRGRAPASGE